MRLNQLAKKVGKPYTRVEKYIRKDLNIEGIEGPNSKVDQEVIDKVISKFGLASATTEEKPKVKLETIEAVPAEISPEERGLEEVNLGFATPAEAVVPNLDGLGESVIEEVVEEQQEETETNEVETHEVETNEEAVVEVVADNQVDETPVEVAQVEEKVIAETIETDETVLHLDKEGTIVAPKVELEGFTVRGKIDIPGVTDVVEEEQEVLTPEQEAELKAAEEAKIEAARIKEEERRKKIDEEAAKAAAYKAEREKREQEALRKKIEEEKKRKREEGKKHYLGQVKEVPKVNKKKKKVNAVQEAEENKAFETKEKYAKTENMTTWQKIVRWFNT